MWQINRRAFIAVLSGRQVSYGTLHILLFVDFFLFTHHTSSSSSSLFWPRLFRTCQTHYISGEKCAHFNVLYSANALYIFPGWILFSYTFPFITEISCTIRCFAVYISQLTQNNASCNSIWLQNRPSSLLHLYFNFQDLQSPENLA